MSKTVEGRFEVRLEPQPLSEEGEAGGLGRMSIDKTFHGDLDGTSRGEMLMVRTPVDGSAGYVALERVTANLEGRAGRFHLQHFGIMNGGEQRLILEVVPDSGTEELTGITGSMEIRIENGGHFYRFEYELPAPER